MNDNHPIHITTFNKGCDRDTDPELTCGQPGTGVYLDGHNTRPVSIDGNTGANEKITGEVLLYPNNKKLTNYSCIGSIIVIDYLVEFWADNAGSGPGICTVDGQVVLKSAAFDIRITHPLQIDRNQSPLNPEVFISDFRVPPYIFNVEDMVDSVTGDPNKYFSAFDPLLYQVNLQSPLDRPAFIELVNVGGGGGKPVGQYSYSMRYSSEEGDRTNWSVDTPLIPIMEGLSSDSLQHPWSKTYGGPPNPSSVTSFAPRLRFRVNNIYNYGFIEIRCTPYNQGAGINFVPKGVIVAKIAIDKGEISVREYLDPADSNTNIVISDAEATQQLAEIEAAKAIHYFDRRTVLMNVKLASKESDLQFLEINGKQGFPVIDKLFTPSHKDPWNHVNRRAYMGGERYGFGVVGFDGVGSSGFVTKASQLKNFQYPNRRDEISAETADYSINRTARAATTQVNHVGQTHEVFDLEAAVSKSDKCSFKNIHRSGSFLGLTGSRSILKVTEDCDEDAGEVENHGARVAAGTTVTVSYQPFTPVAENDNDVTGHNYITNTKVMSQATNLGCISEGDDTRDYRPNGFAPNYFAHGMMIAGVTNFPKWMKAFSVVRSDAAGRVVCQGLGFYSLTKAIYKTIDNAALGGKAQNKVWFYSPDIEQGIVSSNTLNDIIDNPQNYAVQMVSPLGFFSEVYGFENSELACNRDRIVDMVSYIRMIRDSTDPSEINPGEDSNMGIVDTDLNYVDYDKYRNISQNPQTFANHPEKGNKIFSLASVKRKVEGRGQFIEIETTENFYGRAATGGETERHFDDEGLKNFTEPFYIINIIRTGANVPDIDIQKYKPTDHYQKLEAIIGRGNGLPGQNYVLVDERWEDCIPAPLPEQFGASIDRYVYLKSPDGTYKKWINVTYKTAAQLSVITSAINGAGVYNTDIYGVYTHTNINGQGRIYEINFSVSGFYPTQDHYVIVRYDNTAPIRVFGGDTYVGETIFAPIDAKADANADAAETQFAFGIGFPYFKWKLNPRYYTIRKSTASVNLIQDSVELQLGYIRQMVAMFCVEARAGIHLSHNLESPNQFFPMINYVIRPNRWDDTKSALDNGIFQGYFDDYGDEIFNWQYGGFRFLQQVNPDYSCEAPKKYFSKPAFGFVEKTEFITRVMWSLPRAINIQNSPGLRTFPANNSFDIDDNFGEIKFAYDDTTGHGENLYSITEKGICLLITKKSILSDLNAGEIAYMAADTFVQAQYWLNKEIGMIDEMWRSAVVSFVPVGNGDEQTRVKALFFANTRSVFRFMNNQVMDIWGAYNKVYNEGLATLTPGYATKVVSGYNTFYQEYWLYIKNEDTDQCFVYGQSTGMWYGTNDFKFDKITASQTVVYGSRNLETYELNVGYKINGAPIESRLTGGASPEQFLDKEFIALRVNSLDGQKPTAVKFYKQLDGTVQCELSQALQGPLYMKNYRGYEGQIPRIQASVNASRPRLQQRLIIWQIIHNLEAPFKVTSVGTQFKKIKIT